MVPPRRGSPAVSAGIPVPGITMAHPHRQLTWSNRNAQPRIGLTKEVKQEEGKRQRGVGSATKNWRWSQLILKSPFYKRGIKKILLSISKNCLRHKVERHFFISAPGRAQTGFTLVPSALAAAVWPWQHLGTKGQLPIPSSSMGTLPAALGGKDQAGSISDW